MSVQGPGGDPSAPSTGLLVSCIMPTADRRAYATLAVEYFLRQHHGARELVIVDDGADPVDDLAAADPRIRYVRLSARASIGKKRNVACAASRGAIIAHWDDDDWYGAERLTRQVEFLSASGAVVCGLRSLLYLSAVDGRAWRYNYPSTERPWVAGNTLCYWRRAWEEHPFAEIASGEDTRFVWSRHPAAVQVLDDGSWHVGIIHATNTSGFDPSGAWWQPADPAEARSRLGADAALYLPSNGRRVARAAPAPRPRAPSRSTSDPVRARSTEVAVIVTCHAAYLPWLEDALASIDRQEPEPTERVIVLDGCSAPPPPGWQVVVGAYGDPSPARDAGLAATTAPWVVFWDADNVMPAGFLAAVDAAVAQVSPDVAIVYPDLQLCDGALRPTILRRMPDWDYWALRAQNYVDTASAWRREALVLAGCWPRYVVSSNEDYALALDLTAAGWRARPLGGPPVLMRDHGAGRNRLSMEEGGDLDDIWRARTLGIVTLVAARPGTFERWRDYLHAADLPPKTSLYVVDNTGDPAFSARIYDACRDLQRSRGLRSVDITAAGAPYAPRLGGSDEGEDRHRHVARLYASVLRRVAEDLVLTLEDDVEPPLDAVRLLGRAFGWGSAEPVGAVAGAYAWPGFSDLVCAGTGGEEWGDALRWDALPAHPIDVGCVGGGCTMWANWALHDVPVRFWWSRKMGWDAVLCTELRRRNYRVKLHGGVRCVHHVHGELAATQPSPLRHERLRPDELGRVIAPYRSSVGSGPWVSEGHRRLRAAGEPGSLLQGAIPGWLRLEDALKLYELAYSTTGNVLELGSYQGLSTSILAGALAERKRQGRAVVSVDAEPNAVAAARRNLGISGLDRWVTFSCEEAALACRRLSTEGRRFDLVFVDHSHAYLDVATVCRHLSALVSPGGYCLIHDYNDGRNDDPTNDEYDVVRAVDDALDPACFDFAGLYGCSALYRRR